MSTVRKGSHCPRESPVVLCSSVHVLPLGKDLTALGPFSKNRMFIFLFETQGPFITSKF